MAKTSDSSLPGMPRDGSGELIRSRLEGRTRVTIRLDEGIIAWFRAQVETAGGGNYQTLINDALRQYITRTGEPLEETVRRVIREEMKRAS